MTLQIAHNPSKTDIQSTLFHLRSAQQATRDLCEEMTFTGRGSVERAPALLGAIEEQLTPDQKMGIQEELRRLLHSPFFVQSHRLSRFLTFAVETTLQGAGASLKEYTIGVAAYDRRQDFDPCQDSIVRTEARRLRCKVKEYYEEQGRFDPIIISFQPGSYVPVFRVNDATKPRSSEVDRNARTWRSQGILITVAPFTHLAGDAFGEACAHGLTEEVMHCLAKSEGRRIFDTSFEDSDQKCTAQSNRKRDAPITFEGSVRTEGHRIRVTSRIYDSESLNLASWRFDAESSANELFGTLDRIASDIVTCIHRHTAFEMAS